MYEDYFSLSGPAFGLEPDPAFFFGTRTHNRAMSYLHYGLKRGEGFIVLTGAPGAGKTMAAQAFVRQAQDAGITAALAAAAPADADDPLRLVLCAFGLEAGVPDEAREAIGRFLREEMTRGRRTLLMVDDAHALSVEALEALRVLSETTYHGTPLMQICLAGEPALEETLKAPALGALRQRVLAACRLEALAGEETGEYILHRLSAAGWREDPVFTDGALARIHAESSGAPARVNRLCTAVLEHCAAEKAHEATQAIVDAVAARLDDEARGLSCDGQDDGQDDEAARQTGPETARGGEVGTGDAPAPQARGQAPAPVERETALGASEFDRLMASRRRAQTSDPPQEATLSDIASAIAAVTHGADLGEGRGDRRHASGAPLPDREDQSRDGPADMAALRRELSEAEAMIATLRRKTQERRLAGDERDAAFVAGLARADALITQLRRLADAGAP